MAEPNDEDPPRNRSRRDRDDDDRPRRRDDDDDYDDRPRRRRPEGESKGSSGLMIAAIFGGVLLVGCIVVGALVALLLPDDQNNMKQLSLGVLNYESNNGKLPPAQEKVSWRVYILPYIEQESLYRQFKVDESWDSPTNKRHASTRIKTFVSAADPPEMAETRYRVFVGPDTLYEPGKPLPTSRSAKDGPAATILIVESGDTVPWPQPREIQYDRAGALPSFGVPGRGGFNVAMLDGSVKFVSDKTSSDVIRGGIEPNDNRLFEP